MPNSKKVKFFSEMTEHQISVDEFFGGELVNLIYENFGFKNLVISYFDTEGKFLSWLYNDASTLDCETHPYRDFIVGDVVRLTVFKDAVFDKLTYFDTLPRIYKSTDIINKKDYDKSSYVRFLKEVFNSYYSTTLAFGINGYIQVAFFKTEEEGDFCDAEIEELKEIYVCIANSYKTFKKYEQSKIVSNIKTKIIEKGEKAYVILDDFNNIMSISELGKKCLKDILGMEEKELEKGKHCEGLSFIIRTAKLSDDGIRTRVFKDYVMKIHTYNQSYSNGIIDKYHWITKSHKKCSLSLENDTLKATAKNHLTKSERKIVELIHEGMTYKQIAEELVVSYHTVKKHIQNIYTKCNVKSRNQLYKWLEQND